MGTELTNHKPSNLSRSTLHRQTDARAPRIHEQKKSFLSLARSRDPKFHGFGRNLSRCLHIYRDGSMPIVAGRSSFSSGGGERREWNEKKNA